MPVNFWEIQSHTVFLHHDGPGDVHSQQSLTLMNASASYGGDLVRAGGTGLGGQPVEPARQVA
jgi:hypothetical protein